MDAYKEVHLSTVVEALCFISEKIVKNSDKLTKLDSKIGDSDHGENMKRGFQSIKSNREELEEKTTIEGVLVKAGEQLTFNVGGSAGPLFGNLFSEFGKYCGKEKLITKTMLAPGLEASLNKVQELGGAEVGDKTMVDTLSPVVDFLKDIDEFSYEWYELLRKIKTKARKGLESTREIKAQVGRASYLNGRSKGHLDPGAYSCFLIFEGLEEFCRKKSK